MSVDLTLDSIIDDVTTELDVNIARSIIKQIDSLSDNLFTEIANIALRHIVGYKHHCVTMALYDTIQGTTRYVRYGLPECTSVVFKTLERSVRGGNNVVLTINGENYSLAKQYLISEIQLCDIEMNVTIDIFTVISDIVFALREDLHNGKKSVIKDKTDNVIRGYFKKKVRDAQ